MYIKTSEGTRQGSPYVEARKEAWQCTGCERENKPYWVNCPSCSAPRPK